MYDAICQFSQYAISVMHAACVQKLI